MNKVWMTAVAMAAAAGGASAQAYLEAGYGVTQVLAECSGWQTCDKTDRGFKLLAGYTVVPMFSVEAGYMDFGSLKATDQLFGVGQIVGRVDTTAFFVGGALRAPMDHVVPNSAVMMRAGLARVKSTGSEVAAQIGERIDESATSWRPVYGAAVQFGVTPQLKLSVSLDVTHTAHLDNIGSGRVSLLALGAQFTFDGKPLWASWPGAVAAGGGAAVASVDDEPRSQGSRGPKLNYVYGELGIVHSDALDVVKRNYPGAFDYDDNPVGFRLGLGHRWGPYWSTEVALTSYGSHKFKSVEGVSPASDGTVSAAGLSLMSVWRAQTELDLTWVARLGLSHNSSRIETQSAGVSTNDRRRTTAPIYGLGLEHALNKDVRLMFTGDVTHIRVGDERPAIKFYAAGGSLRF
jgi:hypothetical protein